MKRIIAALALTLGMGVGAVLADENIVLTPTNLYDMIHSANVLSYERNKKILERLELLETNKSPAAIEWKLNDIERRLSGVQKQVTILHAKIESTEKKLQESRDQVANMFVMQRHKLQALKSLPTGAEIHPPIDVK